MRSHATTVPHDLSRTQSGVASIPARVRVGAGPIWIDALTADEALAEIEALVNRRAGGAIFTPNMDHIVLARRDDAFRRAYERAALSFVDGTPLLWASRLLGVRLPTKLSGSDMVLPIARLASRRGWRVFLVGAGPSVAREVADRLARECETHIVGVDDSAITLDDAAPSARVLERIRDARADVVLVALGSPKQELWIDRYVDELAPTVAMGVGASFDFLTGRARRAAPWVSAAGLEWAYRLAHEPRRLWRRYVLRDPAAVAILLRHALRPRSERVRLVPRADLTA